MRVQRWLSVDSRPSLLYQVAIYCEGTRFTKEKYLKGVEYAKSHNLPPLKHHLTPRTKGFALLAEYLREGADFKSVIDVGVAYPNTDRPYSHLDILMGRKMDVYWYMRYEDSMSTPKALVTFLEAIEEFS